MKGRLGVHSIPFVFVLAIVALFLPPVACGQDDAEQSKGINSGGYNIHQTLEFGYRTSNINGNKRN